MAGPDPRIRSFQIHMLVFALVALAAVGVEWLVAGGAHWSVFLVVLWGAPLAVHCAWAMGLFGGGRPD